MTLMVEAIIDISDKSNRVLNIVKAKFGLKDKSAAIDRVIETYEEDLMEPKLRPEYVKRLEWIEKEDKSKIYSSLDELNQEIEHATVWSQKPAS